MYQPRIGFVPSVRRRGSTFTLAFTKASIEAENCRKSPGECGRNACRDIWRACVAVWLDCVALDDFDSPDDEDFAGFRVRRMYRLREGNFGLINFDDAFQWFAIRIDHRRRAFVNVKRFVGHRSWSCSCNADMPLECVVIGCGPERHRQRQSGRCITVPAVTGCRPAIKAFVQTRPARRATRRFAAGERKTKPSGHRRLRTEGRTACSSKRFLKLQRTRWPSIVVPATGQIRHSKHSM